MDFQALLRFGVQHDASDVHIQAGLPPYFRLGGLLKATDQLPLEDEHVLNFIASIVPKRLSENLEDRIIAGLDFSYFIPGMARFRCSAYRHLGSNGISMRIIRTKISSIAQLHLPPVCADIALSERGLILVTGTTRSEEHTSELQSPVHLVC